MPGNSILVSVPSSQDTATVTYTSFLSSNDSVPSSKEDKARPLSASLCFTSLWTGPRGGWKLCGHHLEGTYHTGVSILCRLSLSEGQQRIYPIYKVLTVQGDGVTDLAKSSLIRKLFIIGRGTEVFKKIGPFLILWEPYKGSAPSCRDVGF